MTVGLARADRIFYSAAAGVGNPVIYVGAKTGRDGIHALTTSSAQVSYLKAVPGCRKDFD